jgi:hypothetical protein
MPPVGPAKGGGAVSGKRSSCQPSTLNQCWAAEERAKMTAKVISFPAAKTQTKTPAEVTVADEKETLKAAHVSQPTQKEQEEAVQTMVEFARDLLGVSEYSSKRFIKNSIYENFHWKKNKQQGQTQRTFESAVALLLRHHKPTTSKEAKAARAQEEADKKVRDEFHAKLWRVERAEALVVDKELAAVRMILHQVYDSLTVKGRMAFIRIAGSVFNLTRREAKVLGKQEAENRAKWEAAQAKDKAIKNAMEAYWREQNPEKKKALRKVWLDLTQEDRQKKAAEKKAEEKRIASGLANVESVKENDRELWSEAINTAARATVAQAIGRYFWGATLRNRKGNASTYAYGVSDTYKLFQEVIIMLGGILAEHKLELLDDDEYPTYRRAISPRFAQRTVSMNVRLSMSWRVTLPL